MAAALPKLSYVLLAHNREQYVRGAIESAFAQEYEGELEYIFSDDCSTDGTYAIMQECVAAYKGTRRVVLTQTPRNGHLADHTNHAVSFVESDWIVRADDDDYSAIDRCALIGRAIAENPGCTYVVTGLSRFTDEGAAEARAASLVPCGAEAHFRRADIREGYEPLPSHNPGAYSYKAWHMDVFRRFGKLEHNAYYVDDLTCYFRANVLGYGVYADNAPVVLVRDGCGNMCRGGGDNSHGYASIVRLERFNDKYYNLTYTPLARELEAYRHSLEECTDSVECDALQPFLESLARDIERRGILRSYWRKGTFNRFRIMRRFSKLSAFNLARCLPLPLFAALQATFRQLMKLRP